MTIKKIVSLESILIDKLTMAAIEQGCQKHKNTFYVDEVEARLILFNEFLSNTGSRINGVCTNIKRMLLKYNFITTECINDFINAIPLASADHILLLIQEVLYPHISNADDDKFTLGAYIINLNSLFNRDKLSEEYMQLHNIKAPLSTLNIDQSNWVTYVVEHAIKTNTQQLT